MENSQELSEKQLSAGYWYVTHKLLLKNILIAFLFLANFAVWGYAAFSLIFALGIEIKIDQLIGRDLVQDNYLNLAGIKEMTSPKNLVQSSITTLPSFGDRLDIMSQLTNPNTKWAATFNYQYITNAGPSQKYSSFIMPGQEKYLLDLDVLAVSVTKLQISEIKWIRELNYAVLQNERENFGITEAVFTQKGSEATVTSDRAAFIVSNNSNFNYYRPTFQVYLMGTGRVVGVQTLTIDRLLSGQSYPVDIRWFEDIPDVTSIDVVPDIDYLNPDSYLAF